MQPINSTGNSAAYSVIKPMTKPTASQTDKEANSTLASSVASNSLRPQDSGTNKPASVSAKPNNANSIILDDKSQQSQAHQANQTKQSFELDDSKLAIIENHQAASSQGANQALDSASFQLNQQANTFSQTSENSYKEQIPSQNQTAVSTYAMVDNLAQRESVQKLFGVDLFA
jgi:hypothetical protein